jgi:AcrR family transcriptional regulator
MFEARRMVHSLGEDVGTAQRKTQRAGGRPTREDAAALDSLVLTAARRVFCESGYSKASMDQVAAAIGGSKLTIYRRYRSKSALLEALVDHDLARLVATMSQPNESADPLLALRAGAQALFQFSIEPENICFSTFLLAEARLMGELREKFEQWEQIALGPLESLIREAQVLRKLRPGASAPILSVLVDLINGSAQRMRSYRGDIFDGLTPADYFAGRWDVFIRAMAPIRNPRGPSGSPDHGLLIKVE